MKKDWKALGEKVWASVKKMPVKSRLLLAVAGAAALLLVFTPAKKSADNPAQPAPADDAEAYRLQTEEQLTRLLSSISGVGEVRLMVTLETTSEVQYAQTEKSENTKTSAGGDTINEHETYQNEYVIIGTDGNGKEPISTGTVLPTVMGVVVVCRGAGDITVVKNVTEAVCVALGIPSNRVCVKQLS